MFFNGMVQTLQMQICMYFECGRRSIVLWLVHAKLTRRGLRCMSGRQDASLYQTNVATSFMLVPKHSSVKSAPRRWSRTLLQTQTGSTFSTVLQQRHVHIASFDSQGAHGKQQPCLGFWRVHTAPAPRFSLFATLSWIVWML
jgi:hypothetical protein